MPDPLPPTPKSLDQVETDLLAKIAKLEAQLAELTAARDKARAKHAAKKKHGFDL